MSNQEAPKYRIELNHDAIRELLGDKTVQEYVEEQANRIADKANAQVNNSKSVVYVHTNAISNPVINDSLNAFAQMLRIVHDEFGDEAMTEQVICTAINAASYGYWRSVMGGKHPDEGDKRGGGRKVL